MKSKLNLVYQYGWYTERDTYRIHTIRVYSVPDYVETTGKYLKSLGNLLFEIGFQSNTRGEDTKNVYGFRIGALDLDYRLEETLKVVGKVNTAFSTIGSYSKSIRDIAKIFKSLKIRRAKYKKSSDLYFIR